MPVMLVVAIAAALAAAAIWALSRSRSPVDPVDPETEERWLVRWLSRSPRLGAAARSIDRQVVGGDAVAALAVVLVTAFVVGAVFDMVDSNSGLAMGPRGSRVGEPQRHLVVDQRPRCAHRSRRHRPPGGHRRGSRRDRRRRHRNVNVVLFLGVVLAAWPWSTTLKWLVDRERPDVTPISSARRGRRSRPGTRLRQRRRGSPWLSSSPAAGCGAAAPSPPAIAALISVAVAASRALLGVHWFTDVVAGLVVGWGWFLLGALVFGGRFQRLGDPAQRVATQSCALQR